MRTPLHPRRLAAALASLLLAASAASADEKAFKVCADPNNPPYSDKAGQGFENKIAEMFARDLGKTLEYTWFPQRLGFIRNTLKAKPDNAPPDSKEFKCDVIMGLPTGAEMAGTTEPYYRSTYALVYKKGRGLDGLATPADIDKLPEDVKSKLRIAMFDNAPGTTWLLNHKLLEQGIPYQTMTGDASVNTAQTLEKDFRDGKIDMVIVWGPIAGYLLTHGKPDEFGMLPMKSEPGLKFDFPMSMGVRVPDKERKAQLETLIRTNASKIEAILREYRVPLVDKDGNPI
jgi:quinoprotein dehydrogenase-associated probable ABC transporter substrate-binding protein